MTDTDAKSVAESATETGQYLTSERQQSTTSFRSPKAGSTKRQTAKPPATAATPPSKTEVAGSSSSSLSDVVAKGDTRASLERLRDAIAADLEGCDSMRDKAALYLRLTDVLTKLDGLPSAGSQGDIVDEIATRRAARGAGPAAGSSRAKRQV